MVTLNVGLASPSGLIPVERALAALRVVAGWSPRRWALAQSDTEPTLIAEGPTLGASQAYAVADALKQDAIAVWDGREGDLIGPAAAAWGEFDPSFFLTLDGSRLAAPLAKAA